MNMKLGIVMLFLAFLAVPFVAAANYSFDKVEVDSIVAIDTSSASPTTVYVERGETAAIEVWFHGLNGTSTIDDARVKAWINGYEHGNIQDTTDIFTVEPGVSYRKVLRLDIPQDIASGDTPQYTLHVEISDRNGNVENSYNLQVKEQRHDLNIQDVLFNPSSLTVEAGKMLFSTIRIENLGAKREEDVKVTMKIPELGLSTSTYIDQLTTIERTSDNRAEETSQSSDELVLQIPENAEGNYNLVIEVDYNRGNSVLKKEYSLTVKGKALTTGEAAQVTVSVDKTSQNVARGQGSVYQISFSNLGKNARTFSLDVNGEGTWAKSRADPQVLTVQPDSTGEMFVYVTPNEDAPLGSHIFTVNVMSDSKLVQEVNLKADVTAGNTPAATSSSNDLSGFRKGLEVGFIVLLIILVILGIVLAIRKMGKDDNEDSEGKTYY